MDDKQSVTDAALCQGLAGGGQAFSRLQRRRRATSFVCSLRWQAAGLAAALSPLGLTAGGQALHPVHVDETCRCEIVLNHVATLGGANDSVALAENLVLARGAAGRFMIAATDRPSPIAVFDAGGSFSGAFGQPGQGPGELGIVRDIRVGRGDSIVVLDGLRLTVFTPDRAPVRAAALPGGVSAFRFVELRGGHFVLNNYRTTRPAFVVVDRALTQVREFGPAADPDSRTDSDALQYALAATADNGFVAVRQNYRLTIEVWNATGTLMRRIVPPLDWFPAWTRAERLSYVPGTRVFPRVQGANVDARGRLWVVVIVPTMRAVTARPIRRGANGGHEIEAAPRSITEQEKLVDTVIAVFDIESGHSLITQRFNGRIPWFGEGGLMYGTREDSTGLVHVEVWQPTIVPVR